MAIMNDPEKPPRKPLARWQKIVMISLITFGILFTLAFGLRAVRSFRMMQQRSHMRPGETDVEMIRGWMTIPYISFIYQVPEDVLYQSLGIDPASHPRGSLYDFARKMFPNQPGEALARVKTAVRDYQAVHPPTPFPGGTSPRPGTHPAPGTPPFPPEGRPTP
jgi:hypothetical protein